MIKIYSASDTTEAHIVRGMLEAHGIQAYIDGYYLQGGIGELAAHDYVSVSVAKDDAHQASKLVEDYNSGLLISKNTHEHDP